MLGRWHRLSLQVTITTMIVLIFAASAAITEWLEARLLQQTIVDNIHKTALAIGGTVNQNVLNPAQLFNREARTKDIEKIMTTLPDLMNIVLYAFPSGLSDNPTPITSAGPTELPRQEGAPALIHRLRREQGPLIDHADRMNTHRVFLAAPIIVKGVTAGAAFAEISTLQMDEALDSFQRESRVRRLLTGLVVLVAINLFLYFKVHRPVKQVRAAIEAVSGGTMTASVPVEGLDELGELADRFNLMVRKLRETADDNARLTGSLQILKDYLHMKVLQATAELLEKNRALVRANELLSAAKRETARAHRLSAIGQTVATVAHKIGTPLTALSGHIQLMAEDRTLSVESRQRLQMVEAQIERTSKSIQDMLLYARKPEPVRTSLDLTACLGESLALFRPEFDRRKVGLITDWHLQQPKIAADAQQLQEVFNSLVENALDAMPEGGTLTVRIATQAAPQSGHRMLVAVDFIDSGCGMDAEQLNHIFQPFFTLNKAGRGTGLGLTIARETVRAHGGEISVKSEPGKGSHFTILIPTDEGEH